MNKINGISLLPANASCSGTHKNKIKFLVKMLPLRDVTQQLDHILIIAMLTEDNNSNNKTYNKNEFYQKSFSFKWYEKTQSRI